MHRIRMQQGFAGHMLIKGRHALTLRVQHYVLLHCLHEHLSGQLYKLHPMDVWWKVANIAVYDSLQLAMHAGTTVCK